MSNFSISRGKYGNLPEPAQLVQRQLSDPERNVLAVLAQGPCTRRDIEIATGLSRQTVIYHLRRLRGVGRVELIGKERAPNALWRAADA
jgi:uncharacterized membrane protein